MRRNDVVKRRRGAYVVATVRSAPLLAALVGGLLILTGVIPPLLILAVGRAVVIVGAAVHGGLSEAADKKFEVDLVLIGVLFSVDQMLTPLLRSSGDRLAMRLRAEIFQRIFASEVEPSSIVHLEDPDLRDVVDRAVAFRWIGTRWAVVGLVNRWAVRLGGTGGLVLVFLFRWWLGLILLVAVVHSIHRVRRAHMEIVKAQIGQIGTLRRSNYLRDLILKPGAEKETRVFGLGDWLVDWLRREWLDAMAPIWARRRQTVVDVVVGAAPILAAVIAISALAADGAYRRVISIGELAVVLQAVRSALTIVAVSESDTHVELGIDTFDSMVELEAAVASPRVALPGKLDPGEMPVTAIRFESVGFSYRGADRSIFENLDLDIPAGKSLAIVGENGAGKTTLVKLLMRLFDPTSGRILVDGIDLREIDARAWQRRSAAVFQDFVRYPWTLAENVSLTSEPDTVTLERVAEQAALLDLVETLPSGWATPLSRQFKGVDLSGGEWQRVALARALYVAARGAGILVLDEPTAHLDVRQEAAFYDRFFELTAGRTAIVISHRFSTVRRADRIVVLEDGVVAESGSHAELMELRGRYALMFDAQASRFVSDDA